MSEKWMTQKDAADALNKAPSTLSRWRKKSDLDGAVEVAEVEISYIKVGSQVMYSTKDVHALCSVLGLTPDDQATTA